MRRSLSPFPVRALEAFVASSLPRASAEARGRGRALVLVCLGVAALAVGLAVVDPLVWARLDLQLLVLGEVALVLAGPLVLRWTRSLDAALVPLVLALVTPFVLFGIRGDLRAVDALVWVPLLPLIGSLVAGRVGMRLAVGAGLAISLSVAVLVGTGAVAWVSGTRMDPGAFAAMAFTVVAGVAVALTLLDVQVRRAQARLADVGRQLDQARAAAAQADRLATAGLLASGVAHGINNPLLAALDGVESLEQDLSSGKLLQRGRLRGLTAEVSVALGQIRRTVDALGTFADPDVGEDEVLLDPAALLRRVVEALRGSVPAHVRIDLQLARVPRVRARRSELAQALLALVRNAVQASHPGSPPHRVRIICADNGDGCVVIEVIDEGVGMSEAVLARAREPFFTTRDVGEGVGLGLSLADRVVRRLDGTLHLASTEGAGTRARLVLPAADEAVSSPPPRVTSTRERPVVLVVDDERLPLKVVGRVLGARYEVRLESSALEARRRLLAGEDVDLVLTDVMMPGITGDVLFADVVDRRPELAGRFLFMSGAIIRTEVRVALREADAQVILKPFTRDELRAFVDGALERLAAQEPELAPVH